MRYNFSPAYVIGKLYEQALQMKQNCILDSVSIIKEVEFLRKVPNFYLIAIDADINTRYKRIQARKSQTDFVSLEEFRHQEEVDESSQNTNEPNLQKCISLADKVFINNSNINTLHDYCKHWLNEIS